MKYFIAVITLLTFLNAQAQENLDSLWSVWHSEAPDSVKLLALHDLNWAGYIFTKPDSGRILAQLQIEYSRKSGLPRFELRGYNNLGVYYGSRSNNLKAAKQFLKSQKIADSLDLPLESSKALANLGLVYRKQGMYGQAIENYAKAMNIFEAMNDSNGIAATHINMGIVYKDQKDYDSALDHYNQSLRILEANGNKLSRSRALANIGAIHSIRNNPAESVRFYKESLRLKHAVADQVGAAMILNNLGREFRNSGELDSCLDYYTRALDLRITMNDKGGQADSYNTLGYFYYKIGEYHKAIDYYDKGLSINQQFNRIRGLKTSNQYLHFAHKKLGNFAKSLAYYESYINLRDSILSEKNQRQLLRQEYKYEYEREALTDSLEFANREVVMTERSEKQQLGLIASGGGLLLVLALAFAIYNGKKKSDELLLNILPAETAEELKKKGSADAKLIDEVTVLFTDFKGFTAMSEQLSPKELVEDLHRCFSEFDRIMEKHGIEKIKTIGDAYMAAGGLPTPNRTHPQDVVKAALEMAEVVEQGKAKKTAQGQPYFEVRIGVHTGPVVAGIVGVKKFQYDIWGDTVNTASRMESSGEVGKVNISEATHELLKDDQQFSFESRGKIEAKGKGEMEMYFVSRSLSEG